ncbi:AAC(3) family N-acetyltransferase [Campylobacter molothri]|uniref:AAC(3) family N-acetyltransferase n=1 Tax=Campylobacter molothri TaxID=1032242 RepID=A0ACC5W1M5_9BACT|nr:AAC(3) family N-acetyltransferase [Campylobacter sp. RM9754]
MLEQFIKKLGIAKEDCIILTGNFMRLLQKLNGNPRENLNLLFDIFSQKYLSVFDLENGGGDITLAIQTFNWDFCKSLPYDILYSKSQTGALGNIALKRSDFKRTKHPIYSFAVAGKFQNELIALENKGAFDFNSPFDFMFKKNGKMIIVDLPLQDSFAFVHYVEQYFNVDYRHNKSFKSYYINEERDKKLTIYDMFVRNEKILTDIHALENIFLEKYAMKIDFFDNICIKTINLQKAFEIIAADIKDNKGRNLYKRL